MFVVWYSVVLISLLREAGLSTASRTWPGGIYGLPKPKTGCPEEWKNNRWEENGLITQKIIGNRPSNDKSDDLHMAGYVDSRKLEIKYCITSKATSSSKRPAWPEGEYCIYSRRTIQDMIPGNIEMYDYKSITSVSQTCINGFFRKQHRDNYLCFQCKTSGNKKIPISLPITKPFYLLPYGSRDCQQVQWMVATSEWIKDYTYRYHRQSGEIAHYGLKSYLRWNELKMYYCYYESCNKTLTENETDFQSPGFPGNYPDGQLCSWKISVHDNHTLVVNFTKLSLYEYDNDRLEIYESKSGIVKLKQTLFGYHRPFTITATSDLIFVFRSDEENNSNGFKAEYTIFKTPERTTTAKPSTTTTPTTALTTTKRPITKATNTNTNLTNETVQCNPIPTKNKSYNKHSIHQLKKTCFCDEAWRIVVMVIPLTVLIVLVIIDIFCRCRSKKALKSGASGSSADDGMAVNPTYERGNIILDQPADTVTTVTDASTVNTLDDQLQSRDEPPDYEDVDYTQVNDIPPPRRPSKRGECHALEPIGTDTSSVFYHVLEPPRTESYGPQIHAVDPAGNGSPSYQNLSEVNHYTLNPVYEPAENSAPFVEANKLYDNYIA